MITIAIMNSHLTIAVQDSKHSGKTGRNQLNTGARILVIRNEPICYTQLREFGRSLTSMLFIRDVENIDKQDDRAVARLFSAQTLEHHLTLFPD